MTDDTPTVDLTGEAYRYWLRAGRPDFHWFLAQDAIVQESLAQIGDEFLADVAIAIGYAVADPELADAGSAAVTDTDAEEQLIRRVAAGAAARLAGDQSGPPPITHGGLSSRRRAQAAEDQLGKDSGRRLLGRAPDAVRGAG